VRARDLLASIGYQTQYPPEGTPDALAGRLFNEVRLVGQSDGITIELHWRVAHRRFVFDLEHTGIWQRLQWSPFCGSQVHTLAPEDTLLLLCWHGARHAWVRLAWACDVAALLHAQHDWQWAVLLQRADYMGARRILLVGLALARTLRPVPLPAPLTVALEQDAIGRQLVDEFRDSWFRTARRAKIGMPGRLLGTFYYRARERRHDRLRYLLRSLTAPGGLPPQAWMRHYPLAWSLGTTLRVAVSTLRRMADRPN
jgi:hypothetical protein